MPERCVTVQCNNTADAEKRIRMHRNSFFDLENAIAQKRRKKIAVDFVLEKRKNWHPGKTLSLC